MFINMLMPVDIHQFYWQITPNSLYSASSIKKQNASPIYATCFSLCNNKNNSHEALNSQLRTQMHSVPVNCLSACRLLNVQWLHPVSQLNSILRLFTYRWSVEFPWTNTVGKFYTTVIQICLNWKTLLALKMPAETHARTKQWGIRKAKQQRKVSYDKI